MKQYLNFIMATKKEERLNPTKTHTHRYTHRGISEHSVTGSEIINLDRISPPEGVEGTVPVLTRS